MVRDQSSPTRSVLVITGAGASTSLGADDRPIPMMPDWATSLVEQLGDARAKQLRITRDMPGAKFEAELGKFLAFAQSLPLVERFGYLGNPGKGNMGVSPSFTQWSQNAHRAVQETTQDIRVNLFESFNGRRVDNELAAQAYQYLHDDVLGWNLGGTRIWHATTNFDPAIEIAVDIDADFQLVDGFTRPAGGGTRVYEPETFDELAEDGVNFAQVPVVHLHGAVGWYYDENNTIIQDPNDRPYTPGKRPALLLPDNSKNPSNFTAGLDRTWTSFLTLLRAASHVFVIGHSLNDAHLRDALRDCDAALAVLAYRPPGTEGSTAKDQKLYQQLLGREVLVVPGQFHPLGFSAKVRAQLQQWLGA